MGWKERGRESAERKGKKGVGRERKGSGVGERGKERGRESNCTLCSPPLGKEKGKKGERKGSGVELYTLWERKGSGVELYTL
jgi:hypothetical protein